MDLKQLQRQYDAFLHAPRYTSNGDAELYCICRKQDNGDLMVACDGCDEWFHFKCMKLNLKWKNLVKSYYCPFCNILKGKGTPLWKRKCRLMDCYNPINDHSSFCSNDHGELFWKRIISRFDSTDCVDYDQEERITSDELNSLMTLLKSKEQLDTLGDDLPICDNNDYEDAVIIEYLNKIKLNNEEGGKLNERKLVLEAKSLYLIKLKDYISQINDILNSSLDENANIDEDDISKKKKSKKKGTKSSKIDICGYDSNLTQNWDEFIKSDQYKVFIDLILSNELKESIKRDYNSLEVSDMEIEQETTSLRGICLNDKRKCIHSTWFNIERDDVDTKLDILVTQLEGLDAKNNELNRLINIQKWEHI